MIGYGGYESGGLPQHPADPARGTEFHADTTPAPPIVAVSYEYYSCCNVRMVDAFPSFGQIPSTFSGTMSPYDCSPQCHRKNNAYAHWQSLFVFPGSSPHRGAVVLVGSFSMPRDYGNDVLPHPLV